MRFVLVRRACREREALWGTGLWLPFGWLDYGYLDLDLVLFSASPAWVVTIKCSLAVLVKRAQRSCRTKPGWWDAHNELVTGQSSFRKQRRGL